MKTSSYTAGDRFLWIGNMETKEGEGIRQVRSTSLLTKEALSRVRRYPTRHYHRERLRKIKAEQNVEKCPTAYI